MLWSIHQSSDMSLACHSQIRFIRLYHQDVRYGPRLAIFVTSFFLISKVQKVILWCIEPSLYLRWGSVLINLTQALGLRSSIMMFLPHLPIALFQAGLSLLTLVSAATNYTVDDQDPLFHFSTGSDGWQNITTNNISMEVNLDIDKGHRLSNSSKSSANITYTCAYRFPSYLSNITFCFYFKLTVK
jgi:hypothetical protein